MAFPSTYSSSDNILGTKRKFNMASKLLKAIIALLTLSLCGCDKFYEIVRVENLYDQPIYLMDIPIGYGTPPGFRTTLIEPHENYKIYGDTHEERKSYFKRIRAIEFNFKDDKRNDIFSITLSEAQLRALNWTVKYPLSDADKEIIEEYKVPYEDNNNRQP